ncbi:hypothetical protein D3C72_2385900 [compost metagenome]
MRIEGRFGDDQQGFDIVGSQRFQAFGALQPVDGAVTAAGTQIGMGDLRMRVELPHLFKHA